MAEALFHARLVWSGGALGPTKSVESYSRKFQAEFDGKPSLRGSADPAFRGDPALYNPEDLLLRARMVFARGSTVSAAKTFGIIPISCFYKRGRATGLGKAFSSFWSWWASLGLSPRRQVGLEVKGRRTGRPHTLALVIAEHEGEQYLVSMLGECEWVKNVRAQGEAHIISGRRRKVKLEEVPIEHRAPIIKEYIRLAPGGRPHIGLSTTATLADCQRVAPNHPVFRIVFQNGPTRSR